MKMYGQVLYISNPNKHSRSVGVGKIRVRAFFDNKVEFCLEWSKNFHKPTI